MFEPLEQRRLLADTVAHWIGGSGDWWTASNWDIGVVPNNSGPTTYAVVIDVAASNPTITINRDTTVNSLTNAETIRVTSGLGLLCLNCAWIGF